MLYRIVHNKLTFILFLICNIVRKTINTVDSVKWSWSSPSSLIKGLEYKVELVSDAASTTPSGFTSGEPSLTGSDILLERMILFI